MNDQTGGYYVVEVGPPIGLLVALGLLLASAVWVYFDAKSLGARRGLVSGMAGTGPAMWAFGVVAMWILVFPLYLLNRSKIRAAAQASRRPGPFSYQGHARTGWQQHQPSSGWGPNTGQPVTPPAGWFLDPERPDLLRWWDGTAWTEHRIQKPR